MDTLGKRIKYLREKQGMTQKQLAGSVGIREATLSRYENNKRDSQWQVLGKLAAELHTSTDYLLGLTDNFLPVNLGSSNGEMAQEYSDLLLKFDRLSYDNKIRVIERIEVILETQ